MCPPEGRCTCLSRVRGLLPHSHVLASRILARSSLYASTSRTGTAWSTSMRGLPGLTGLGPINGHILTLINLCALPDRARQILPTTMNKLIQQSRRAIVPVLLVAGAALGQNPRRAAPAVSPPFSVVEASIDDMRKALEQKRTTSHEIVRQSLERIAMRSEELHAVITVNPRALAIADSLDRLRAQGRILGPLHGIPVALKDNIHTTDMPTTGGALAFADLVPPYEATLTKNLEAAGAIILAKAQLTELANWVASGMPGNYNGLNGYGMNPWDPRRDPRDPFFDGRPVLTTGGSSSGTGTNVSFWAGNVGTETSGSILSPSNQNMLVGIKPTVGRVSRYGVIPIKIGRA